MSKAYITYNLPLQIWPDGEGDASVLNYMPRKESVTHLRLSDLLEGTTREDFFESVALRYENLARLFREAKNDPEMTIYYPDEGIETSGEKGGE